MKIPEDRVLDLAVPLVPGRRIDLRREVLRRLDLEAGSLGRVRILRRSVDARRKNRIRILFRLEIAPPDGESAAGTDPGRAGEIAFPDWSRSGERRIGSRPTGPRLRGLPSGSACCKSELTSYLATSCLRTDYRGDAPGQASRCHNLLSLLIANSPFVNRDPFRMEKLIDNHLSILGKCRSGALHFNLDGECLALLE